MRRFFFSLRFSLILLVLLTIIPAAGLLGYTSFRERQSLANAARNHLLTIAQQVASQQKLFAQSSLHLLSSLALVREVKQGDSEACSALLGTLMQENPCYANLWVIGPTGESWCSAVPSDIPVNYSDRSWFRRTLKTRRFAAGGYVIGRVTRKPLATFAYPLVDEAGNVQAVLAAGLDLAWFNKYLADVPLPEGAILIVLDSEGRILAHTQEPEKWIGKKMSEPEVVRTLKERPGQGTLEVTGRDGVRYMYTYAPFPSGEEDPTKGEEAGYVIVGIPTALIYADADRVLWDTLAALGGLTLLALAAAWVGGNFFLMRRVKALLAATRRMAQGDLSARTGIPYGVSELSELAQAFDMMGESLERQHRERGKAEASLKQSRERLTHLLTVGPVLLYNLIPDGFRPTWVSPNVTNLLGYTPEEVLQPGWWSDHLHPDDREQAFATANDIFAKDRVVHEYRFYKKDGVLIWVHDELHLVRDSQGNPIEIVGAWIDITERKQAEEQISRQLQVITALYAGSQKLAESLDMQTIASEIVRTCVEIFDVKLAWIGLAEEDGRVIVISQFPADHPYPRQITVRWDDTPEGQGPTGCAIRSGVQQEIPDLLTAPQFAPWRPVAEKLGFRSSAALPLISRGHTLGALNLYGGQPGPFNPKQMETFQALANQAAAALENARLFSAVQHRLNELETLFTLSSGLRSAQTTEEMLPLLLREVRQRLNADAGLVALLDPHGEHFTIELADGLLAPNTGRSFGIEEGGEVLRTRKPYHTSDYSSDPGRLAELENGEEIGPAAFVPLQSEEALLGVLMVARARTPEKPPFTSEQVHLFATISEMVGTALRRMNLYYEALRRLKQVQALRNIDMAITSSLDPRVTLRILLDEVTTQLNVDAADVLLLNPHVQVLEYAAGRGFRDQAIERSRLRLGEGHAGRAALERCTVNIPDLNAERDKFLRADLLKGDNFVSYTASPMICKGNVLGVLETFHRTPLKQNREWIELLETLAGQAAIAIDNAYLFADLQQSHIDLRLAYDATIEGWSRAMDLRDKETEDHTQRVTDLTVKLARAMGIREEEIVHVRRGALLHDIGKMGIPDTILLKPGKLTDEEWEIMRQHPRYAYEMLSPIEYLRAAIDIPYCHHEKWDGTGYPRGLKGKEIPLAARIFAVVDVWDALTRDRPYRKAWSHEKALEYIREQAGTHFDAKVVEEFFRVIR